LDNTSPSEPSLDATRQKQARRYASIQRFLSLADYLLGGILLVALLLNGLSRQLTQFLALPAVPGAAIYFAGLMLAYALITAPLDYYTGYILPRRYGLSRQTPGGWLVDHLKTAGLGFVLGAVLVALGILAAVICRRILVAMGLVRGHAYQPGAECACPSSHPAAIFQNQTAGRGRNQKPAWRIWLTRRISRSRALYRRVWF